MKKIILSLGIVVCLVADARACSDIYTWIETCRQHQGRLSSIPACMAQGCRTLTHEEAHEILVDETNPRLLQEIYNECNSEGDSDGDDEGY